MLLFSLFPSITIETQANEQVGYSVEAEIPENQLDPSLSYFDLRVNPGDEQELNITIYNHENEEIIVQGAIYNAATNRNGLVVYEEQEEIDSSLENPITEFVTLEEKEWTIPAGESETITAIMNLPDEPFDGIKIGGFYFERVLDEAEEHEGVNIENRYAYVIGLQLSENDDPVEPNLELQSVEPGLVNQRTAVVAAIQNSEPLLMEDVTIQAAVYEENASDPMLETEQEGINMAPNSTMEFVIDWNNQPLQAGNYMLELVATGGEAEWQWEEGFTIEQEDEQVNETAVEIENTVATETASNNTGWFIAGFVVLALIIVGLLVYIRKLKK
jgi:hypothetical protein